MHSGPQRWILLLLALEAAVTRPPNKNGQRTISGPGHRCRPNDRRCRCTLAEVERGACGMETLQPGIYSWGGPLCDVSDLLILLLLLLFCQEFLAHFVWHHHRTRWLCCGGI